MKSTHYQVSNTLKSPGLARVQYLSYVWQVSIDDIMAKNWNLDFKNPKGGEVEEELSSKELLERILAKEDQVKDLLETI
jgi:hypothetical protein